MSSGMNKITAERNQRALLELASQSGNDVCADCKARNPRWASHNLGIFICMNCASIHRKMGTHISKVKSLTMDTWTKEQLEVMRNIGNIKSNAHYNPDETRHPPPTNMIDSERDSDLEKYIRSKYEFKSFLSRSAQVASVLGPSRSASSRVPAAPPLRAQTAPLQDPALTETVASTSSVPPPVPPKTPVAVSTSPLTSTSLPQSQFRSVSQPVSISPTTYMQQSQPSQLASQSQPQAAGMSSSNWNTLMSLQSSTTSTLPLQYNSNPQPPTSVPQPSAHMTGNPFPSAGNSYNALSASPSTPFPSSMPSGQMAGSFGRSMSLNTGLTFNGGMGPGMSPSAAASQPFSSQSQVGLGFSGPFPTPSPNAFAPQPLPTGNNAGGMGMGTMFGQQTQGSSMSPFGTPSFQPQSSFGQQLQSQTQPQPQPSPSPMFQTMSLAQPSMQMQMQMPGPTNPFMQAQQVHTPYATQPQYGMGTPSPFGQPQQQQQQQQNPFAGWQGQQNGYAGQQWSGM